MRAPHTKRWRGPHHRLRSGEHWHSTVYRALGDDACMVDLESQVMTLAVDDAVRDDADVLLVVALRRLVVREENLGACRAEHVL